jgi:hypothetical protein
MRHLIAGGLVLMVGASIPPCEAGTLDRAAAKCFAVTREDMIRVPPAGRNLGTSVAPTLSSGPAKSTKKAFFLSLLLPGLGQRYLGQERRSHIYLGAEAGVWIAVASFWLQGSMREDRYREYSDIVAGAAPDVSDDDYYRDLALYGSSDVFAMVIRWEARALFPDDLEGQRRYYQQNIYPENKSWFWPDKASFDEYKRLRRRSKRAYRKAVNVIGLALLNRLVSAIDTVTGKEREELVGGLEPRFSLRTLPGDDSRISYVHICHTF